MVRSNVEKLPAPLPKTVFGIMKNFLSKHPDMVDKKTRHDAWAHTYSGFANCLHRSGQGIGPTLEAVFAGTEFSPSIPTGMERDYQGISGREIIWVVPLNFRDEHTPV